MSKNELRETLAHIARLPGDFRRDTPLLLKAMDRMEEIKCEMQQLDPEANGYNIDENAKFYLQKEL